MIWPRIFYVILQPRSSTFPDCVKLLNDALIGLRFGFCAVFCSVLWFGRLRTHLNRQQHIRYSFMHIHPEHQTDKCSTTSFHHQIFFCFYFINFKVCLQIIVLSGQRCKVFMVSHQISLVKADAVFLQVVCRIYLLQASQRRITETEMNRANAQQPMCT